MSTNMKNIKKSIKKESILERDFNIQYSPFPNSEKRYLEGRIHPIKVPVRVIEVGIR